jgi:hypothetical protein
VSHVGDLWLLGLPERHAVAFGLRARNALSGDAAAWSVLLNSLASEYLLPSLTSDGRLVVDPHPLANVAWHRPPDSAHRRSLQTSWISKGKRVFC